MDEVPSGVCILYSLSCGLSDRDLTEQYDILARTGGKQSSTTEDEDDADDADDAEEMKEDEPISKGTGSQLKLKTWVQRKQKNMGYSTAHNLPIPLIDQIHRIMHLWKEGDVAKVDEYLESRGLRRLAIFPRFLQALIELSENGTKERSLLESISNHLVAKGRENTNKQDTWIEKTEN